MTWPVPVLALPRQDGKAGRAPLGHEAVAGRAGGQRVLAWVAVGALIVVAALIAEISDLPAGRVWVWRRR